MQAELQAILDSALAGEDISAADGLLLLQQREPPAIAAIQAAADSLRQQQSGDTVTYVVNRNINYTNICEQHCSFCAFRRDADQPGAYWLNWDQLLEKAADGVARGATEICMQGGLNPAAKLQGQSLTYYSKLVTLIKQQFPQLHIHAFSPQEVQFIAREDRLDYPSVIAALRDAGVDSLPGTAAEVLDDKVRRVLCPEKINSATWLEIVGLAHAAGLPTTSTMLSGHIETPLQRIQHLDQLRRLQQRSLAAGPVAISELDAISPSSARPCC
jgi:FO synthase subunit 2